jgi:hypothetical protein
MYLIVLLMGSNLRKASALPPVPISSSLILRESLPLS